MPIGNRNASPRYLTSAPTRFRAPTTSTPRPLAARVAPRITGGAYARVMRILVLGAGHVGRAVVEALHAEHEITVIDVDARRLATLSDRYDVRIVEGDGT